MTTLETRMNNKDFATVIILFVGSDELKPTNKLGNNSHMYTIKFKRK